MLYHLVSDDAQLTTELLVKYPSLSSKLWYAGEHTPFKVPDTSRQNLKWKYLPTNSVHRFLMGNNVLGQDDRPLQHLFNKLCAVRKFSPEQVPGPSVTPRMYSSACEARSHYVG